MKNLKTVILIIVVLFSYSFTDYGSGVKTTKVNESNTKLKTNSTDYIMITVVFQAGTTRSQINSYRNGFSRNVNLISYKSCLGVLPSEIWLISATSYRSIEPGPGGTLGGGNKDDDELTINPELDNDTPSFVVSAIVDKNISIDDFNRASCIASGL